MKTFYFFAFVWLESSMSVTIKYIDPRQEKDVIVYSHTDSQYRWIYKKAKLSNGYFFPIEQNKLFKLSDVLANLTKNPPTNSIPIHTEVLTFPSSGSIVLEDGSSCNDCWIRGVIARVRERGVYSINTNRCSYSRGTNVVESVTLNSHISQIQIFSDDSENVWKDKICKKTGPLHVKVAYKASNCNYYKLGWLQYRPKVKITVTDNGYLYFILIKDSYVDITEDELPAVKELVNNQMVIAKVQNQWLAGYYQRQTPEGGHLVKLNGNRETEVTINGVNDLRVLNYQVRPFCNDWGKFPTTETTTQKNLITSLPENTTELCDECHTGETTSPPVSKRTVLLAVGVVVGVGLILVLAYFLFVLLRNQKRREERRKSLSQKTPSCGVRDTHVTPSGGVRDTPGAAVIRSDSMSVPVQETVPETHMMPYDVPKRTINENSYTQVNKNKETTLYAEVDLVNGRNFETSQDPTSTYDRLARNNMPDVTKGTEPKPKSADRTYDKLRPEQEYFVYDDQYTLPIDCEHPSDYDDRYKKA